MLYLLDTNVIGDIARDRPEVQARLRSLGAEDVVITCPFVRGEAIYGTERMPEGRRRRDVAAKNAVILASFACHSVPEHAADCYARIKVECQRRGSPLDENDLWIAATAIALRATLVTRDAHFRRIEGLVCDDWSSSTGPS
jgi:tRNA(fMet)-specific endonuclease VapC